MIWAYPPEVHEFVKKWASILRDQELAQACNKELGTSFTASSMKSFRGNHGYRNYKKQWTSEEYWKYQTRWPQGMYEFIRDNSWGVSSKEMAEMVNEKFGTNFNMHRMKVFRARYHIRSGCTGWYQKGHPPGTKGKKMEEFVKDPEKLANTVRTRFKKGNRPVNELPVGSISDICHRLYIKVADTGEQWERWKALHRYVWEEQNGPIPEGHCIMFKDGDYTNCDISNLELVTKGELAVVSLKEYRSADPDLTMAGLGVVRLRNAVKDLKEKGGSTE